MKSPEPPDSHHLTAADGWLGLGNWQEAQSEIEEITPELRMHPDVQEVRWQIQAKAKNWEEAICVAREITQRTPELPFGWIHLAYSLHELRRTQEAYGTLKPIAERPSFCSISRTRNVGMRQHTNSTIVIRPFLSENCQLRSQDRGFAVCPAPPERRNC